MDTNEVLKALNTAFHELNEARMVRDRIQGVLDKKKAEIESIEGRIKSIKESSGLARVRSTKEEMQAMRARIRITVREAEGEPLYPHEIADNAGLDVEQTRRILRDEAAKDSPIKNLQESRKESKYYWDFAWRPKNG